MPRPVASPTALASYLAALGIETSREPDGSLVDTEGRRWWIDRLTRPGDELIRWARTQNGRESEHAARTHGRLVTR